MIVVHELILTFNTAGSHLLENLKSKEHYLKKFKEHYKSIQNYYMC